jgi:ribosome-binding factor A
MPPILESDFKLPTRHTNAKLHRDLRHMSLYIKMCTLSTHILEIKESRRQEEGTFSEVLLRMELSRTPTLRADEEKSLQRRLDGAVRILEGKPGRSGI